MIHRVINTKKLLSIVLATDILNLEKTEKKFVTNVKEGEEGKSTHYVLEITYQNH